MSLASIQNFLDNLARTYEKFHEKNNETWKRYKKFDYKYKKWLTVNDDHNFRFEDLNEKQGWIPIDEPFQNGEQYPQHKFASRSNIAYRREEG